MTFILPQDRRMTQRIPVSITVRERSDAGSVMCVATDISSRGMALRRASGNRPDGPLVLEFSLPGTDDIIRVKAQYVRAQNSGDRLRGAVVFERTPTRIISWLKEGAANTIT